MKTGEEHVPGGFALVEGALALARHAPPAAKGAYLVGTAPFVAGAIAFWATMASSGFARQVLPAAALGLALLFLWMVLWQSRAMRILLADLSAESPPPWGVAAAFRTLCRQGLIQVSAVVLYPVAFLVLAPLPWLHAFYGHAAALDSGDRAPLRALAGAAARQATRWPRQNVVLVWLLSPLVYLVIALVWLTLIPLLDTLRDEFFQFLVLFYSVLLTLALLPLAPLALVALLNVIAGGVLFFTLLNAFLGVSSPFVTAAEAAFNTTYVAACLGLAHLIVDPICRAGYVLRVHLAQCRESGADLRQGIARLRGVAKPLAVGLIVLVPLSAAADAPTPAPTVDPVALDRALDAELDRAQYVWRMPRARGEAEESGITAILRAMVQWINETLRAIRDAVDRFFDWLFGRGGGVGMSADSLERIGGVLRFTVVALSLALLAALLALVFRQWRNRPAVPVALADLPPAPPDVASEDTTADALPESGWLALADDLLARGEHRLAARALFLALLAALARREWITVARAKSNLDYRRELRLRARDREAVVSGFDACSRAFESVWYGTHPATGDLIAQLRGHLGQIAHE